MRILRFSPRFRKAYRSLETYAARERWSRVRIESFQLEQLNALWEHAVAYVPYYRNMCAERHLPKQFASLEEFQANVPVLPKSAVRSRKRDFLSLRAARGRWRYTGGSTGTPTSVFRSHEAHLEMLRSRYRFHQMWGVDIFDRAVFLWGHSASFAPGLDGYIARLKRPFEDRLRNRLRLSAYKLGRDDLCRYLRVIERFRPAWIYAYSSAGELLAIEAEARGFECESLKLVNLTAEPAHQRIVQTVERAFSVPAVVEYGSIECGFLAGEWPDRTLRVREDNVLLETLPRHDGRLDIVVTVLGNRSFPLIRYAIEDITDAPLQRPDRGFAILKNVAGRNVDFVVTANGRYLHGILFDDILEQHPAFRRWRVCQHADGSVTVFVESGDCPGESVCATLRERLEGLLDGYSVELRFVPTLPRTAAGKHRFVISDLMDRLKGQSAGGIGE